MWEGSKTQGYFCPRLLILSHICVVIRVKLCFYLVVYGKYTPFIKCSFSTSDLQLCLIQNKPYKLRYTAFTEKHLDLRIPKRSISPQILFEPCLTCNYVLFRISHINCVKFITLNILKREQLPQNFYGYASLSRTFFGA